MIGRITKTTASHTHTANAIRAHTNGGYSERVMTRSRAGINDRTVAGYGNSMIGNSGSGNMRQKALNAQELAQAKMLREQAREQGYHVGYGRASEIVLENRQEINSNLEQGGLRSRTEGANIRYDTTRASRGRLGGNAGMQQQRTNRFSDVPGRFGSGSVSGARGTTGVGGPSSQINGAFGGTARPIPKPNFRRPM